MEKEIYIVGDSNNLKPFMIVKYLRDYGNSHYVGHKILSRFRTKKEAEKEKLKIEK